MNLKSKEIKIANFDIVRIVIVLVKKRVKNSLERLDFIEEKKRIEIKALLECQSGKKFSFSFKKLFY